MKARSPIVGSYIAQDEAEWNHSEVVKDSFSVEVAHSVNREKKDACLRAGIEIPSYRG